MHYSTHFVTGGQKHTHTHGSLSLSLITLESLEGRHSAKPPTPLPAPPPEDIGVQIEGALVRAELTEKAPKIPDLGPQRQAGA